MAATAAAIANLTAPPAPTTTANPSSAPATKKNALAAPLVKTKNVDSSARQNHVSHARKNYGSSTPSFKSKCQALLSQLSSCENIQNEYLLATESRQEVCAAFVPTQLNVMAPGCITRRNHDVAFRSFFFI